MKYLAIVDADSIFFKLAYRDGPKTGLKLAYKKFLAEMRVEIENKVCDLFDGDTVEMKIAVKGPNNFRKALYSPYKGTRKPLDTKLAERINYVCNYAIELGAVPAEGMEADDLVAIWAYEARELEMPYVICGIDKDLLQIPGKHFNYNRRDWRDINDDEGHLLLMTQCLTGDNTDNIPGLKGVGPKKAEKLLLDVPKFERWNTVVKAWEGIGMFEADVLLSYSLLRMLTTWDEFDAIQNKVKRKTAKCEQRLGSPRVQKVQDEGLSSISESTDTSTETN